MYFKDAQAVILAFCLDNAQTFHNLETWLTEVEEKSQEQNYVKVIVGNKCDVLN